MKKSEFIYFDKLVIHGKFPYNKNLGINNYGGISYDKHESIITMQEIVNSIIDNDLYATKNNFLDKYDFEYIVYIISRNHIEFNNSKEIEEYINQNINSLNNDNLYSFLVSIANQSLEEYDFNGNLKYGYIDLGISIDSEIFMSKNDIGLKASLFKEGDIVTKNGHPNELYKVILSDNENFSKGSRINYNGTVIISPLLDNDGKHKHFERYARSELNKLEN